MRPLFISGCARSGTTALAQFLGAHPEVLMGVERYGRKMQKTFDLTADHLSLQRFRSIEPDDTHYTSFEGRYGWDPHIDAKLRGELPLSYIGDKKPRLFSFFSEIQAAFPDAAHAFIFREPMEVALSWENRAARKDGSWPPARGAKRAAVEWNRSLQCASDAVQQGIPVALVEYDEFFSDARYSPLLAFLGLDDCEETSRAFQRLGTGHQRRRIRRAGEDSYSELPPELAEEVGALFDADLHAWARAAAVTRGD